QSLKRANRLTRFTARVRAGMPALLPRYFLLFSNFQPDGNTAAASSILIISPGMNGSTVKLSALKAFVRVDKANHPQPQKIITSEPIDMARTAVKKRRSQSCSANAPVINAPAGKATRYP